MSTPQTWRDYAARALERERALRCHCGEPISVTHFTDLAGVFDEHGTRCCNCFDSLIGGPECSDMSWFCAECGRG